MNTTDNLTSKEKELFDDLACSEGIEAVLILKDRQWHFSGVANQTDNTRKVLKALREAVKADHYWAQVSGSKVTIE